MNKQIFALFLLINFILLTVRITPSKLVVLVLVSMMVLKLYKKVYGYRSIDKFKATTISNTQNQSVTLKLIGIFLQLLAKPNGLQKNLTFICVSTAFLGLTLFVSTETIILCIFNFFFLAELMVILNLQNRNKIRKKLGIIKTKSINISEQQPQKYLNVPRPPDVLKNL